MPEYQLTRATTVKDRTKKSVQARSVVMSEAAYERMKKKLEGMTHIVEAAQAVRIHLGRIDATNEIFVQSIVELCAQVDLYDGLALLPEREEVVHSLIDIIRDLEQTNPEDDAT